MEKEKTKTIYVEIPESLHQEIKKHALFRYMTMSKYVRETLINRIKEDIKFWGEQ